ncbi:uncharacterized protein LOC111135920 isoform X2 [Crassostrea virginica]
MKQRKKLSSTIRSKDQKRNPFTGNGFSERSNKNGESVHPSEHGTEPPLFPKCSKWIVFGITLVLRCTYVTRKENWWLLHPDEIFQSMEALENFPFHCNIRPSTCRLFLQQSCHQKS